MIERVTASAFGKRSYDKLKACEQAERIDDLEQRIRVLESRKYRRVWHCPQCLAEFHSGFILVHTDIVCPRCNVKMVEIDDG